MTESEIEKPKRLPTKAESALSLRMAGATYEEIAWALDYRSTEAAKRACSKFLAQNIPESDVAEHRAVATARMERLLRGVWAKAVDPNNPEQMMAQDRALRLVRNIVDINGAAAPQQVVVTTPTTRAIEEFVGKLLAEGMPPVAEVDPFELPGRVQDAVIVEENGEPVDVPSEHEGQT